MSIVAVSDVHLGMENADQASFIEFLNWLDYEEVEHLVLLGDIIDMWRRDFTGVLLECSETLSLLSSLTKKTKVHYVVGNHDYYMLRLSEVLKKNYPFEVSKSTVLRSKDQEFYFTHGYQLEVLCNSTCRSMRSYETFSEGLCLAGDDTGNAADELWKAYLDNKSIWYSLKRLPKNPLEALRCMMASPEKRVKKMQQKECLDHIMKLAQSEIRHFMLGIDPEQFLVYGHTHVPSQPYEPEKYRVANTGSWGLGEDGNFCYLEIEADQVNHRQF